MAKKAPKTGRRLILADGTRLENAEAGYGSGILWCYVPASSIVEVFPLFSDPAKTGTITFEYGEMSDVYEGYTTVTAIIQGESEIRISLTKQ